MYDLKLEISKVSRNFKCLDAYRFKFRIESQLFFNNQKKKTCVENNLPFIDFDNFVIRYREKDFQFTKKKNNYIKNIFYIFLNIFKIL